YLVITLAIEPRFALWNTHILSESLGMTLAVVSVVCWVRFAHNPAASTVRWAALATIGWMLTRDSNVIPALAATVPAMLAASWWWRSAGERLRSSLRVWAVVLIAVGLVVSVAQADSGRNRYPTMNNVGLRVLPNPGLTAWFAGHGMPVDATLLGRAGHSSFDDGFAMLTWPELAEFRRWADTS
ncbi:MAG TPA: hypothetical protein PLV68_11805, partial [Ilumatobacteraceae bacterium]|nr:hypothetical protein [Ilumatobacteraceae bacterium]